MDRRIISSLGFAVAAALLAQPSYAGDRKSSANRDGGAVSAMSHAVMAPAMPTRGSSDARGRGADDPLAFALLNNAAPKSARAVGHDATATEQKKDEPTTPRERKSLTFFHFDSKLGNVSVQPVVGAVKGAQFSLGF